MARCAACGLQRELCVCARVPRRSTRVRVELVVHPLELDKPTGTARLVVAALERATLRPSVEVAAGAFAGRACVLFPSEDALELAEAGPIETLIVPDGTYRQASKLARRHPALASLPRVRLPSHVHATARVRAERRPERLSTLEAVARAIGALESRELEAELLELLELVVARTRWSRGLLREGEVPGGIPIEARLARGRGARS